ncbi:hypothetical protein GF362_04955 [Candidatus Dojkabacteria bacterium]|nr:hypothetical protein [Candidatus Dojkabacteria bacterium]
MEKKRTVSRKVIGSANPFARKYRDIKKAFGGIGCGFFAIFLGLVLIFASVKAVKEHSKTVAKLPLKQAAEINSDDSGMVKILGNPSITNQQIFTYTKCFDLDCEFEEDEQHEVRDSLYLEAVYERYEVVEETRTETYTKVENGQDVEYTEEITEYVEKWVEKNSKSLWSDFKLGEVTIIPENAKKVFDLKTEEIQNVYIANLEPVKKYSGHEPSSQVGTTRLKIKYLPNDKELIVVGDLQNNKIEGGESFIISDKKDEDLASSLKSEEKTMKTVLLVAAWFLLTTGFSAIIAPVMEIVEIIPVVGKMTKFVAGIISAILSAFIVLSVWMFVKFWYLICGCIVLILVGLLYLLITNAQKKEGGKVESSEAKE